VSSFELHLAAENKAAGMIRIISAKQAELGKLAITG
jgi:hypothetical protein